MPYWSQKSDRLVRVLEEEVDAALPEAARVRERREIGTKNFILIAGLVGDRKEDRIVGC